MLTCYSVTKRRVIPVISVEDVESSLDSQGDTSHTMLALRSTCLEICKLCHNHEAFLLADMHDYFLIMLVLKCDETVCLNSCKRSSRWLLFEILERFCDLIEVQKMSRKYSTLLIYKNLDIRRALHISCAKLRYQSKKPDDGMYSDEDFKPP